MEIDKKYREMAKEDKDFDIRNTDKFKNALYTFSLYHVKVYYIDCDC